MVHYMYSLAAIVNSALMGKDKSEMTTLIVGVRSRKTTTRSFEDIAALY